MTSLALVFVINLLVVSTTIGLLVWRNTYAMSCLRTRQQKGEVFQVCIPHERCSAFCAIALHAISYECEAITH